MNGSGKLNEGGLTIKRMAGRKGGRRRVRKGFAMTLTPELARELVNRRWKRENDNPNRASSEQEKLSDKH